MSAFDELLAANQAYPDRYTGSGLSAPPARRVAVLTCMDARVLPLAAFGLELGDAHVVRNAGGRVTDDALRSLLVSTHALGVRTIVVMHHTECGVAKMTDEQFRDTVVEATGHDPAPITLMAIGDPDRTLADDVRVVASSPLFPAGVEVAGFRFDVATGRVAQVVPPVVVGGATAC